MNSLQCSIFSSNELMQNVNRHCSSSVRHFNLKFSIKNRLINRVVIEQCRWQATGFCRSSSCCTKSRAALHADKTRRQASKSRFMERLIFLVFMLTPPPRRQVGFSRRGKLNAEQLPPSNLLILPWER